MSLVLRRRFPAVELKLHGASEDMPSRFADNAKRQSEYTIVQPGGAALSIPSVFSILFRFPVTLNVG